MLLEIPDILTSAQVREFRDALQKAAWQDGRKTAGHVAMAAKDNHQVAQDDPIAARLGDAILQRLGASARFMAAALPHRVLPPRFNRYTGGESYDLHIDNAVFSVPGTPFRIRSDLSATLFLSEPDEYEGGELVIQHRFGTQRAKLPAGHMMLYSAHTLHRVEPVTHGTRLASFFWVQSLVRSEDQRDLLLELDDTIQALRAEAPDSPALVRLTGLYHNLLRQWADT